MTPRARSTVSVVDVAERIRAHGDELTTAERRIAEVILSSPQTIGFGTVAAFSKSAEVGAASVVRFASKIGFEGYSELQQAVQAELLQQLRPAAERIGAIAHESYADHAEAEIANVRATLGGIDPVAMESLVSRLAALDRPVLVVSSDASRGVAHHFVDQLYQLRPDVQLAGGSSVEIVRELAVAHSRTTVVVVDLRRYEQWVLDAQQTAVQRGLWVAGVTDSVLSPIASRAAVALVVSAVSPGPFDSYVGMLGLFNLIAIEVGAELRDSASERLAAIEEAWSERGSLSAGE